MTVSKIGLLLLLGKTSVCVSADTYDSEPTHCKAPRGFLFL